VLQILSLDELKDFLEKNNSNFEIIKHDKPIISTQDAAKYFDIERSVPTFIMDTDLGLVALIISTKHGKIAFQKLKQNLGFSKFKMADKEKVKKETGYQTGAIPLVGHSLPCIFDECLLEHD
jgi:prolyl-tRNA editing enzyme YbaK/EbsC (Cys-tRNA(Pro) deacylase)